MADYVRPEDRVRNAAALVTNFPLWTRRLQIMGMNVPFAGPVMAVLNYNAQGQLQRMEGCQDHEQFCSPALGTWKESFAKVQESDGSYLYTLNLRGDLNEPGQGVQGRYPWAESGPRADETDQPVGQTGVSAPTIINALPVGAAKAPLLHKLA